MSDATARAAALDPKRSFIVQAPAGSGKTELLIQRYLALLATVDEPEQVVAITFTRKAAAEMRARVQRALRRAEQREDDIKDHERTTLRLAQVVMARDGARDWRLQDQPQRLRIDTLDAFNTWLARQLPVLADGVAAVGVLDKADELYRLAARRALGASPDAGRREDLATLLKGVGNDFGQLERLLAALLPRRDQWLGVLAGAAPDELRGALEGALQRLIDDELVALAQLCPPSLSRRLAPLLRHAASAATAALADTLQPWLGLDTAPREGPLALAAWRGVAALLLTKEGRWRKRITKSEGFGPDNAELRETLRELLAELEAQEDLRAALARVSALPDAAFTDGQWRSMLALQGVLVRLAAELKVAFAERRQLDFMELAAAAQRALGHVEEPSELLLALDRRIQHLLVDEFQDTSQSQRRLLELLTAGWQPGDGRTLFLVGDPMQSIYRFRDADMSLFLLAKQRGIGAIPLASLTLEQNFRSGPAVVEWVNAAFSRVFPAEDDLAGGRAAFRPSTAARGPAADQFVRSAPVPAGQSEADEVVRILEEETARDPGQSIAVLVQSRTHLKGVRERLRARGLPAHAVEIDTLAEHQVAQDLAGLTRALLHLDDRIAWLAALRAPWCGLTWADLHALCHDDAKSAIYDLVREAERTLRLSEDGRRRLAAWTATVGSALARRPSDTLARWIEDTWIELGGPDCLDSEADHQAAQQFFGLLGAAERGGDLDDPAELHRSLDTVQPQADPPAEHGIEIMTMHRAKGLEFDTVVLLGLSREPRADDPKALYWMQRVARDGRDDLIMVPASEGPGDRLTDFVRRVERQRDAAERSRLLYVATTRARERLHLVWQEPENGSAPPASSLLAQIWGVLERHDAAPGATSASRAEDSATLTPVLRRLAAPGELDLAAVRREREPTPQLEFSWAGEAAIHVGTVVHGYLQRVAEQGLDSWSPQRVAAERGAIGRELELLGVETRELGSAIERVATALTRAIGDPRGRWLLGSHDEARAELRLTLRGANSLEHVRVDRTFVADGKRWIVDYKTSQHEGADTAAFLESEVLRYAPQLEQYARAFAALDSRPIQLALYFPLLGELRSWPAATASPSS
jgi:ATP-dependent exoDNAse (exonuclease V) beta subunit